MRCLLRLLIQHKAIGIADHWSVVCVEEDLVWDLLRSGWGGSCATLISAQFSFIYIDDFTGG